MSPIPSRVPPPPRLATARLLALAVAVAVAAAGCATAPPPPPLATNPMLAGLVESVRWQGTPDITLIVAGQQLLAARRHREGRELFDAALRQDRERPLLLAFRAVFQAKMADEVPLLSRIGWVRRAVADLDQAVAQGGEPQAPVLRYLRGQVLAELPALFGEAKRGLADLNYVQLHIDFFPFDLTRGVARSRAAAYRTLGDRPQADRWLAVAGADRPDAPLILDARTAGPLGSRMSAPRLVEVAPEVLVAEGYDFSELVFLRGPGGGVVAIDAGTTRPAVAAARAEVEARWGTIDVRTLVFTHGHWDHVGGVDALRGPATRIVAQRGFAAQLDHCNHSAPPFPWFFGAWQPVAITATEVVDGRATIDAAGRALELWHLPGSETDDALLVIDRTSGVAFAGDAFMPYLGAPTEAEGSAEALVEAIRVIRRAAPRILIHGHTPLTRFFTVEALPGLEASLSLLLSDLQRAVAAGEPLTSFRDRQGLPAGLRQHPQAVFPYLVVRDGFIERYYHRHTGYWAHDGGGIDRFSDKEEAAALDLAAGGSPGRLAAAIARLERSGDYALGLRLARLARLAHPGDAALQAAERRLFDRRREQVHLVDPFRFFAYSQFEGAPLSPTLPLPVLPTGPSSPAATAPGSAPR